jgi:hypothetical protein
MLYKHLDRRGRDEKLSNNDRANVRYNIIVVQRLPGSNPICDVGPEPC